VSGGETWLGRSLLIGTLDPLRQTAQDPGCRGRRVRSAWGLGSSGVDAGDQVVGVWVRECQEGLCLRLD
jgi:hypothetical protein